MTNRDDVTEAMQSIDALAASIPDTNLAIAVRRFFRYTAPEDIAGKTAQDLAREVTWFMAIAGTRAPAAPLVTAEQVGSQLRLILVNDDALRTLPIGMLFFQGKYTVNTPVLTAGAIIVIAPIVVVYLIFQRRFIEGLTAGASK